VAPPLRRDSARCAYVLRMDAKEVGSFGGQQAV